MCNCYHASVKHSDAYVPLRVQVHRLSWSIFEARYVFLLAFISEQGIVDITAPKAIITNDVSYVDLEPSEKDQQQEEAMIYLQA